MKIDWKQFDGSVTLAVNRRKGLWASSLLLKNSPTTRQAGNVGSSDLSTDNLYSIALSNSLRGIGLKQRQQLVGKDNRKVRLLVTVDPSGADFIAGMERTKESHVSANFRRDLNAQVSKYALTYEVEQSGGYVIPTLERWAQNVVSPVDFLPAIYQRSAYSQTYQR